MGGHHDLGYKDLFAHPEMVRDLLVGFTELPCLRLLEPSAFERVNASYVSEQFSERHGDMVWKVRLNGQILFIYLLLEFQSHCERWMALRMQVYIGLLYQDLVKRGELADAARLPPVLPVVFYNGKTPWSASDELRALVAPAPDELAEFQASQRYLLIDQSLLDPVQLETTRNLVALLFRIELSDPPGVLIDVVPTLRNWLAGSERASLRRSIAAWIERLLLRETGGHDLGSIETLLESDAMGERYQRKFASWAEYLEDQGRQRGLAEGRKEGREEGREEGRAQALRETLERQLQHRFGSIPDARHSTIEQATATALERWIDRAFEAPTLEAVFAE
jgi:predicted transposase YdaD